MAQTVKHLPTMQETWVRSLVREDPLEKEMVTHSSILAWKIPWTEEPSRLQSVGSPSRTRLSDFTSLLHCRWILYQLSYEGSLIYTLHLHMSSIQFSCSVVSDFATPWTTAHQASLCITNFWSLLKLMPIESVIPSNQTISSSDVSFSSHLQSFPATGSFQMSQFFASGGQSIGVSASASVLPMNIQD